MSVRSRAAAGSVIVATCLVLASAVSASATTTVLGVSRRGAQVGAAGVTCGPVDFAAAVAIVPGTGAGAVQGRLGVDGPQRFAQLLGAGAPASEAVATVSEDDPSRAERQYAAVVLADGGAVVATHGRPFTRGVAQDDVAVVGSSLRRPSQVGRVLAAFRSAEDRPLAERLLAALGAAERSGGDRRCGDQRGSSAFLIVTDPQDRPVVPARDLDRARRRQRHVLDTLGGHVASDELADRLLGAAALPRPSGPGAPAVYLSILQPRGGFDAVDLLRQAYAQTAAPSGSPGAPSPTAGRTMDPLGHEGGLPRGWFVWVIGAITVVGLLSALAARRREDDA
jgi:uncharacterized Ntn-hydrolase superfamily protein